MGHLSERPVLAAQSRPVVEANMTAPEETSRAVVLVVEDEPLIRLLAAEVLEEEGFDVLEAATAPAALALLEKRPEVQALFTDIDMPGGMNGLELAQVVHERYPHIALVVTSGVFRVAASRLPDDACSCPSPIPPLLPCG
jgi:response regulator RpfG family c-di-GMP phosphodiesterase